VVGTGSGSIDIGGLEEGFAGNSLIAVVPLSSGSGDGVGLFPISSSSIQIYVPVTYISGSALSDTSTWGDHTIAGLGLITGTHTYDFGSGNTADSITVNIGGASAPEPGTTGLLGLAAMTLMFRSLRKRA